MRPKNALGWRIMVSRDDHKNDAAHGQQRTTNRVGAPQPQLDAAFIKCEVAGMADSTYELDVRARRLAAITDLKSVPRLRSLDVSWNALRNLGSLMGVPQLRELKAASNKLIEISAISSCRHLEVVALQDNELTEAPLVLASLRKLRTLRLDRNRIAHAVGPGLSQCTSLRSLDLSGNQLSSVAGLASLASLTDLDLSHNCIEYLPASALDGCRTTLCELRLADNKIGDSVPTARESEQTCSLQALVGFSSLRSLNIATNRCISFIGWPVLTALGELDCRHNRLATLDGLDSQMPHIDILDLGCNQLADIGEVVKVLKRLPELVELYLAGNPCAPWGRKRSHRPSTASTERIEPLTKKSAARPSTAVRASTGRPQTPLRMPTPSLSWRDDRDAPGWALVCGRALNKLQVLDDLVVDASVQAKPPRLVPVKNKYSRGLAKVEPVADVERKANDFRTALSRIKVELRRIEQDALDLPPRPPLETALNKRTLNRALSFSLRNRHGERSPRVQPAPKPPTPPPFNDELVPDDNSDKDTNVSDDVHCLDNVPLPADPPSSDDDDDDAVLREYRNAVNPNFVPDAASGPETSDDSVFTTEYQSMMASYCTALRDSGIKAQAHSFPSTRKMSSSPSPERSPRPNYATLRQPDKAASGLKSKGRSSFKRISAASRRRVITAAAMTQQADNNRHLSKKQPASSASIPKARMRSDAPVETSVATRKARR